MAGILGKYPSNATSSILSGMPAAPPAPQAPQAPRGPNLRRLGDIPATRQMLYDRVLRAASNLLPVQNVRHSLELTNVHYTDPADRSIAERKQAIIANQSLARRLRGTWLLRDRATGNVLDKKTTTLAHIPHMTDAGTFVHNGNEYVVSHQMRLKPGIFTRVKENGEIESHINVIGKGMAHRYFLDPAKGVFYARIGQAKIPLMPLLRALGAQDKDLREAWGDELLSANYQADTPAALNKFFDKLVKKVEPGTNPDRRQLLVAAISGMELDPDVVEATLGKRFTNLGLDAILATTRKLAAVSRGEEEVDDRDHLAFQTIVGPEDLFAERLEKDAGGLRRLLLHKASFRGDLRGMPTNALNKQIESLLLSSGLGAAIEEINPSEIYDKQTKITRLGEGSIGSIDAIPDEARAVQPSHFGFVDPLRSPESFRVGVDLNLARAIQKGDDGRIYAPFVDVKTGEMLLRSPQDLAKKVVAFPGEMTRYGTYYAAAMQNGRIRYVPKDKVDYALPHFEDAMSPLSNLVPLKSAIKGQRAVMGSRMITQALPLASPEAPLVQSGMPGRPARSFEEEYGVQMGALRATGNGVVQAVEDHAVTVRYRDGTTKTHELYDNLPHARKTFLHQTPTVQPGQPVREGDLLARSNYTTDDKGVTALGVNARVAWIPWAGANHEDAFVISESMAKKFSSVHMYNHTLDFDEGYKTGRGSFVSLFPSKFNRAQLETLDDTGVVRPGTVLQYGDPLIVAAKPRQTGHHKVHKRGSPSFVDVSETWSHRAPGLVTDVVAGPKSATVLVKSMMPMEVGDKFSDRHGGKGVVAKILPDDQMPILADGQPAEVAQNPLGIVSRTNPAGIVETVLGKIAAATGRPYKIPDFEDIDDLTEFAIGELRKHGLKDVEHVIEPRTGRKIPNVLTGNRFYMKLHHTAESKTQSRATGGYTSAGEPAKGGPSGSKKLALLESNALLSHGALGVLQDASLVRGQRNEDFWLAYMQGHAPPKPKVPLVYQKFVNELKAAGINVVPDGPNLNIMALTDRDVKALAGGRELKNGETVRLDQGLKPVTGGLFDPTLTGGHQGDRWSFVRLQEPMPSPVMEEPIRRLLGLTQAKFLDVLAGKERLPTGTGPRAIQQALSEINLPREIAAARMTITSGKRTARDQAVRKLGYLKSCQQLGIHPRDWMLSAVPVLPPRFRPISVMEGTGTPLVADLNYLYRELIDANDNLRDMTKRVADVGDERLAVYKAFQAVTGLTDPTHPKLVEKNVQGILKGIFGSSPKYGTLQRRLISSTTDLVGRATVTPDPDLDMDHVGLPENKAWEVYKPFVIRRLRRRNLPLLEAARHFQDRTPLARQELLAEMGERPVIVNRAPVLHRFGIMAFWPRLVKGDVLKVSPLIVTGFNADFDGDSCSLDTRLVLRIDGQVTSMSAREFLAEHLAMPTDKYAARIWQLQRVETIGRAGEWAPVKSFSLHPHANELWQITLRDGQCLKVTGDHSLLVNGDSVRPSELAVGDTLDHAKLPDSPRFLYSSPWENGYLDGYFIGDGCVNEDVVAFASAERDYREQLREYIRATRQLHANVSDKHNYIHVGSQRWAEELLTTFGRYANGKHISDLIFNREEEYLFGFLGGYIDSDGSVEKTASGSYLARIWSVSFDLIRDTSFICYTLGIPHSLRFRNRGKKTPAWVLNIGRDGIRILVARFRQRSRKLDKLNTAMLEYASRKTEKRAFLHQAYRVEKIERIPAEGWVCDIEADGAFAVENGILIHNTMQYHVPATQAAVEDAAERMLPSRNLLSPADFKTPVHKPGQEYVGGLYSATAPPAGKQRPHRFIDARSAIEAYRRGDIPINAAVEIVT